MQNAKDSVYAALRDRMVALDPSWTVTVRGVSRPALLVMENELATVADPEDCFCMRWVSATRTEGALPGVVLRCEVTYRTRGTAGVAGMDRGRRLSALDDLLWAVIGAAPRRTGKRDWSGVPYGQPVKAMATNVWWGVPEFEPVKQVGEALQRTAVFEVMALEEAAE